MGHDGIQVRGDICGKGWSYQWMLGWVIGLFGYGGGDDSIDIYLFQQMNYIQRAWLVALRPVSSFVNEKLAKKTGILGRIGRFYAFGPREFGYHPTNRLLTYVNHILVTNMGFIFHKYSMVKSLTMNGHTYLRTYRVLMFLGMASFLYSAFILSVPRDYGTEEGTTLRFIKDRLNASPINALQQRVSAHYTEINSLYLHEMTKKYLQKREEIIEKRNGVPDEVKKTRYARPGYEYVAPHTNYREVALD